MTLINSLLSLRDAYAAAYVTPSEIAALRAAAVHVKGDAAPRKWTASEIARFLSQPAHFARLIQLERRN